MWYRKAIDTSKPPFEIEEPEAQMHPLLKRLHERIEAGEMSESEFFPTLYFPFQQQWRKCPRISHPESF